MKYVKKLNFCFIWNNTSRYVRVNLPLNGRLYSYTVSFDGDRREIDPNNTFIVVSKNALQSPMTVPVVIHVSPIY